MTELVLKIWLTFFILAVPLMFAIAEDMLREYPKLHNAAAYFCLGVIIVAFPLAIAMIWFG